MKHTALLLGEDEQGSSHLTRCLQTHGCECWFAASYEDACALIDVRRFSLVLSPLRLRDTSLFPLIAMLEGSGTNLFYFQPVEYSCWWLPALLHGENCFGSNALRPNQFVALLNEMFHPAPARVQPLAEMETLPLALPRRSAMVVPRAEAALAAAGPVRAKPSRYLAQRNAAENW